MTRTLELTLDLQSANYIEKFQFKHGYCFLIATLLKSMLCQEVMIQNSVTSFMLSGIEWNRKPRSLNR